MREAAIWAVSLVFWCSVGFVGAASLFWVWWRSPFGRAFVTFDVFLTITLFPSVLGIEFGVAVDTVFWQWATITGFFAIAAAIPWKTWVLFRVQAGPKDGILTNRQALDLLVSQFSRPRLKNR